MKPTQIAELFANIKATIVSFFSIAMFVALGVGVFAGIYWMAPALQSTVDEAFGEGDLHNFQIQFPYGLTQQDLEQLRAVEGVDAVEAGRVSYATFVRDDAKRAVKIQTIGSEMDAPRVVKGGLPTGAGQVALDASAAETLGLDVGDTIQVTEIGAGSTGPEDASQLAADTFTVTALAESAEYLARSSQTYGLAPTGTGMVDAVAWAPASTFNDSAYQNGYPLVNIRCGALESAMTFTKEYEGASDALKAQIVALGSKLAPARFDDLHDKAEAQVAEGERQLASAKKKIVEGEKKIKSGEQELERGQAELKRQVEAGKSKLVDAHRKLVNAEDDKRRAGRKLANARAKLDKAKAALDQLDEAEDTAKSTRAEMRAFKAAQDKALKAGKITQEKYNENLDKNGAEQSAKLKSIAKTAGVSVPKIDHTNYADVISMIPTILNAIENTTVDVEGESMTIAQARKKVAASQKKVSAAEAEYSSKSTELSNAWSKYYDGQRELETKKAQGEKKIADGKVQLKKAKKKLKEAKAQVKEKEPELEAAKEKVAALQKYEWAVAERAYNGGALEASTLAGITTRLSFSMAALFLIVGLLVSYSAIGRIVREQITQVGTKKALGLRGREITASFLLYAALAVVLGSVIGLVVGVFAVERVIGHAFAARFTFDGIAPYFDIGLALAATGVELVLVLGAAWLSCHTILRENAVELLKGEKPPAGKTRFYEKWGFWQKLPLYTQTIINNCVNDKRRVFSTIVGIAGCTALVVTAITLNNDVMKSYDMQYEGVYGFDSIAFADDGVEGSAENVARALQEDGHGCAVVVRRIQAVQLPGGGRSSARVVVPADTKSFERLYHIESTQGDAVDLTADGVWVARAYESHVGAKIGDEVAFSASDGSVRKLPIVGFFEFYLVGNEMVVGRDAYERYFETDFVPNAVLCDVGEGSFDATRAKLEAVDGFASLLDDKTFEYQSFAAFSNVSRAVVLIYLVLAVLMAIVVLLNLNVMFIEEKKRELIVLMINGFSVRDAKRYIYNDTIVLTVIGVVVGLVLGAAMGSITVGTMEPATAWFFKGIDWPAIGIASVVSVVLSTIMSLIALRRIPAFRLTDINKA